MELHAGVFVASRSGGSERRLSNIQVKLDDSRVIRRHGEQLRHRQDTGDPRRTSENATLETELNPTARGDSLLDAAEHSDPSHGPPAPTGTAESEPPLESHEEPSNSVSIQSNHNLLNRKQPNHNRMTYSSMNRHSCQRFLHWVQMELRNLEDPLGCIIHPWGMTAMFIMYEYLFLYHLSN